MNNLDLIIGISLFCLGLREITDDVGGRIGYPVKQFLLKIGIPVWILKPIILCVTCMPSFWGSILYFSMIIVNYDVEIFYDLQVYVQWLIIIISCSFINTLLWGMRNKYLGL